MRLTRVSVMFLMLEMVLEADGHSEVLVFDDHGRTTPKWALNSHSAVVVDGDMSLRVL